MWQACQKTDESRSAPVQHPLFVDKYLLAIVIGSGGRDPRRGGDHEEGKQEVAEIEDLRPHVVQGWDRREYTKKTPYRLATP